MEQAFTNPLFTHQPLHLTKELTQTTMRLLGSSFSKLKSYLKPARRAYLSLALLRILLGAFFIYDGYTKLNDPSFSVRLPSMLAGWAANNPIFFYQDLLNVLIIPNGWFFAHVVTYTEFVLGVGYVLGLFMPVMIPLQIFLNLNFLMATQHTHPSELIVNGAFLAMALVLYLSNAGTHYGLDQWVLPALNWTQGKTRRKSLKNTRLKSTPKKKAKKEMITLEDSEDAYEDEDNDVDLVELADMKKRKKATRI